MYSIFDYTVTLSPNFNFSNKTGFYNFPVYNSFRRVALQALYDGKYLSKALLNELLTKHYAFPILRVFNSKKYFSFCPCDTTPKKRVILEGLYHMSLDFLIDTKFTTKVLPKNYPSHSYPPPTLLGSIDRNIKIVIPTPSCSLEFMRKCLRNGGRGFATQDCLKSFFPNRTSEDYPILTFDIFFFNNSKMAFGNTVNDTIYDPKGIQGSFDYFCIFVYFTLNSSNVMFILLFPSSDYQILIESYCDFVINGEVFQMVGYFPAYSDGSYWFYEGINRCNRYWCWDQYEFISLPKG